MRLIEDEVARWNRDGFLHIPSLLPPVAQERFRRWVIAANGDEPASLARDARGLSNHSAAYLASHHTGLARLLERGLLPEIAAQLLGAPVRPADSASSPTHRLVKCVVALQDGLAQPYEVMAGQYQQDEDEPQGDWTSIQIEAGDLLWVHGLAPHRGHPSQALFLEYRALDTQTTFGWSEHGLRARA